VEPVIQDSIPIRHSNRIGRVVSSLFHNEMVDDEFLGFVFVVVVAALHPPADAPRQQFWLVLRQVNHNHKNHDTDDDVLVSNDEFGGVDLDSHSPPASPFPTVVTQSTADGDDDDDPVQTHRQDQQECVQAIPTPGRWNPDTVRCMLVGWLVVRTLSCQTTFFWGARSYRSQDGKKNKTMSFDSCLSLGAPPMLLLAPGFAGSPPDILSFVDVVVTRCA